MEVFRKLGHIAFFFLSVNRMNAEMDIPTFAAEISSLRRSIFDRRRPTMADLSFFNFFPLFMLFKICFVRFTFRLRKMQTLTPVVIP